MAATPSIKITKTSPYKGVTKTWSNRYHFSGGTPADSAHWAALATAIIAQEKQTLPADTSITGATGYAAGSDVPVWSASYSTACTYTPAGGSKRQALEVVALIRFATAARTTKNHPVYLFKYMHAVYVQTGSDNELLETAARANFDSYASAWLAGFSDGTNTYVLAGPRGAIATGRLTETHVTHRDFPR